MTYKELHELLAESDWQEDEEREKQIQEGTYIYTLDGPIATKYGNIRKEIFARYEREKEENDNTTNIPFREIHKQVIERLDREKEMKNNNNQNSNSNT